MNKPTQPHIPGLPRPDESALLRAEIETQTRAAKTARSDMQKAALELAGYMATHMGPHGEGLTYQGVYNPLSDYREAKKRFLQSTAAAGDAARELRREEHRMLEENNAEEAADEEAAEKEEV